MSERWKIALLVAGPIVCASGGGIITGGTGTTSAGGVLVVLVGIALAIFAGGIPIEPTPSEFLGEYPAAMTARLDPVSRWLWLVKWFLAIPHAIIVFFLGISAFILTVAAFFAILATGRYPEHLFATNVGILRWIWRVGYYAFTTLGTDRYPPFTLADTDYPIRLTVERPTRLSRRLVLVKWWLLALPQYLILATFSGGSGPDPSTARPGLLTMVVLIALVALLFSGRYPRGLWDLVVGLHRWTFRVLTYVLLMHDVYPPFRLDQGADDRLGHGG